MLGERGPIVLHGGLEGLERLDLDFLRAAGGFLVGAGLGQDTFEVGPRTWLVVGVVVYFLWSASTGE